MVSDAGSCGSVVNLKYGFCVMPNFTCATLARGDRINRNANVCAFAKHSHSCISPQHVNGVQSIRRSDGHVKRMRCILSANDTDGESISLATSPEPLRNRFASPSSSGPSGCNEHGYRRSISYGDKAIAKSVHRVRHLHIR